MDYQTFVLSLLLNKYETSTFYQTGNFKRKIALIVSKVPQIHNRIEDYAEKENFLYAIEYLRKMNLIDYSWVKFEKNNIVEKIWLNLNEQSINEAYQLIGKKKKNDKISELNIILGTAINCCPSETLIKKFLQEQLQKINQKNIPALFDASSKDIQDLIDCLIRLNNNTEKISERVLSIELYNDSKYFEKNVKSRLLIILRKLYSDEEITDENILSKYGLSRWPEIYEFLGHISIQIENNNIDYSYLKYGAYIDSTTTEKIRSVFLSPKIKNILFVENKANYEWLKTKINLQKTLLIYHGGQYGLSKGNWFKKIFAAANSNIKFYHWSDIDLGGFLIFNNIKKIIPQIQPYKMDTETYNQYCNKLSKTISPEYNDKLHKLLNKPEYSLFYDVIKLIIKNRKTIEQEQIISQNEALILPF